MEPTLRSLFNAHYTEEFYRGYITSLESKLGCKIPFRVAETPLFMPASLRGHLEKSAREIVKQISSPDLITKMKRAIPKHLDVAGMDHLPNCVQVDFAIVRGASGELEGRVVELQAFPSLYALMVVQTEVMGELLSKIPGLPPRYSMYFGGYEKASFVARLREAVLGGEDPEHIALLDLDPPNQKTFPDFAATKLLIDVDAVCPTALEKEGKKLYRRIDGRRVPVKRIYNRIVFDELEAKKTDLPFSYLDDLDVTWFSHPNWYWTWSKYTLPFVDHPAVPRARYLSDLKEIPHDLERFVLKPLFSFAGSGVKVDVTREDIDAIPDDQRHGWILQEKIAYEPALTMPDGNGVKGEVRMMFLRGPKDDAPELVINLVRLSRGKMLGVDQNKNLTWVGGSVGIWPVD